MLQLKEIDAGVDRFVDTPVKRYSSGMNARLGFSIAAHLNPDVLLIDEVLAVGDMAFQAKCQERMKRFRTEGVAIVFVSHHLPAVASLCSQVLLIERGAPVRIGPPAAVIAEYCSGNTAGDQEHVAIAATLGAATGRENGAMLEVAPGDRLELDVTLEFRIDIERATIGVVVWDVTRELYAYGATSDLVGVPPIAAKSGDVRTFTFSLDANLTRGLYAVEVNVADHVRHRFLGLVRVHHFQVIEDVTYDGIANLFLTGREGVAVRPSPEARSALAR